MASIFTKIINNELPAFRLFENESVISFLALDQINLGHALVVPKKEVNHFFDMDRDLYNEVFRVSKFLSETIKKVTEMNRVGMAIQGFEVTHAHVHLIPLSSPKDFSFSQGKKREDADMKNIQEKIVADLTQRGLC